jgi:hypothetical protein
MLGDWFGARAIAGGFMLTDREGCINDDDGDAPGGRGGVAARRTGAWKGCGGAFLGERIGPGPDGPLVFTESLDGWLAV